MRLLPVLVLVSGAFVATVVRADPTPVQSAYCVAALKARAEPLAERVRRGETAVEAQLLPIVTASFAFIGSAYKQGIREREADELMRQAEKQQATLPPAELTKIQDGCQVQGERLFSDANYFEQWFVARAARMRIERLRKKT